jgi:cytochrome c oxidase cbb3-type subunit 4
MTVDYETLSRFAQQGGSIYFFALFAAALVYALWPRNKSAFSKAARIPLDDGEEER